MKVQVSNTNSPVWRDITVRSKVPDQLKPLQEMSKNLLFVWNHDIAALFSALDLNLWRQTKGNPVKLLENISYETLEEITKNESFMQQMEKVYRIYRSYIDIPPDAERASIAYFSMEFGLSSTLKIYSGGLGVLAGDYLKEASDSNVNLCGVGFLYRYGYFNQSLSFDGHQVVSYDPQNFSQSPVEEVLDDDGSQLVLEVSFPGRIIYCNIWLVKVGRVSLYLMDTDHEKNSEFDRSITYQLYGGDWENRMKQEYLLGIGGIQLLSRLGIKKDVYHCNEGHAALINVQRLTDYIQKDHLIFEQALEVVRSSSLYTVHTPVPAGHDSFEESLFHKYLLEYPDRLGITWQELMNLGREEPGSNEKFSMSVFACNTCQEVNGVSWLHGKVSQNMFQPIWKGYMPEELHVSYVTNGVHMPTWAANEWKQLFKVELGSDLFNDQSNPKIWEKIYRIDDEKIWKVRTKLKGKLIDYIKQECGNNWLNNQYDPTRTVSIIEQINPNALFIGFARRFATYKRAHLLFTDIDRLARIVNNQDFPVQFIFSGKAHPADGGGQALIQRIVEISRRPEFMGKIIFLENYDMRVSKYLVSGVDVWLNTPTRPLEASGTSGEKATMNGVLNFSVLDGWWYEGYQEDAGWSLTDKRTYQDQSQQDLLDAFTIYNILEKEIIPLFFDRRGKDYSHDWVQYIKNSFAKIAPHFTMKRMIDDYYDRFYTKEAKRTEVLKLNNFEKAKEIAAWKNAVAAKWDQIQVVSIEIPEGLQHNPHIGESYPINVVIDKKELKGLLGVELIVTNLDNANMNLYGIEELELVKTEESVSYYYLDYMLMNAGVFKYSFRMFPKNPDLPHRQDFAYVRWF